MKKTSLLLAFGAFLLVACGQKGPLYLPQPAQPKAPAVKPAPEKTSAPASNAADKTN